MKSLELPLEYIENNNEKVILSFIDEEEGALYEVIWNKQKYDQKQGKYVPDKGKELEVASWCQQYLGVPIESIFDAEGQVHTVYISDRFNSLWKSSVGFTEDMVGKIFSTKVEDVKTDDKQIEVFYEINDKLHSTHMRYTVWRNDRQLINPQKRRKQQAKFEEYFGVPYTEAEKAIGKEIMVECKKAFSNVYYGEIKNS